MNIFSCIDELEKLGAISDDEARKALDRIDTLEKSNPTSKQVARYATIGAVAGPAVSALGNVIKGDPTFGGKSKLRHIVGEAAKGAVASGAIPLVRGHLDRKAELGTLKQYMQEQNHTRAGA